VFFIRFGLASHANYAFILIGFRLEITLAGAACLYGMLLIGESIRG